MFLTARSSQQREREEINKSTSNDLPSKHKQTQCCVLCYFLRWDRASSEGSHWWPISSGSNLVMHQIVFSQTTKWLHYLMRYLLIKAPRNQPVLCFQHGPFYSKKGGRLEGMGKLKSFTSQFFFYLKFLSLKSQGGKKRLKFCFDMFNIFFSCYTKHKSRHISWVPGDVLIRAVQWLSQSLSASQDKCVSFLYSDNIQNSFF